MGLTLVLTVSMIDGEKKADNMERKMGVVLSGHVSSEEPSFPPLLIVPSPTVLGLLEDGCSGGTLGPVDGGVVAIVITTNEECTPVELGFFGHCLRNHGLMYSVQEFLNVQRPWQDYLGPEGPAREGRQLTQLASVFLITGLY